MDGLSRILFGFFYWSGFVVAGLGVYYGSAPLGLLGVVFAINSIPRQVQ